MQEPPSTVGSPSELADAEEVPGCLALPLKYVLGAPILLVWLVKEIITLPLDLILMLVDKFRPKHHD